MDAAVDTVGVDEAIDASLALVQDRRRIVSTAAFARAERDGFQSVGAANPSSGPFRAAARRSILDLAERGQAHRPDRPTFPSATHGAPSRPSPETTPTASWRS